ncbi:penicillin acylase [Pseudooceanicola batsensis HTCC2597]|uniref:Penicillin acylase n=1 Tax=Pseudooceanicola batsensis (strain ATCC BAA-863 / DSM 15984 / KCTC 12145 / HTCC2597) TaxID=252305 RepID=A3U1A8_PSEBH|nr:penicillin acylase family protein [Pseudooceanicola batsensis]EAQ02091.1 penicillin acylase [Pseudooceanicola batsensis HTCC2597]
MGQTMQPDQQTLAGLSAPGVITIDKWGIPHIRAETESDLFFLQGVNAARERLWQIDLWRKRGLGLLAESFGPGYLEQDRATRLFLYRGDMTAEWSAYSPDAHEICTAFTNGINAWIDQLERTGADLPPEFRRTNSRPHKWEPEDVVRIRSHSMMRNGLSEIIRANVIDRANASVDLLRQYLQPLREVTPPDGFDPGSVPVKALDLFKLAIAPVSFEPERMNAGSDEVHDWRVPTVTGDVVRDSNGQGSNNWVISPESSATGRPIMASDPHRAHAVPSLRYIAHLTCPTLDVIGAGEPCLPGICIGHNGTAAFGLTLFFGPDQEDIRVYETHPEDPDLYRYGEDWERMDIVEETVPMQGHPDQVLRLRFTRHGPVIWSEGALAVAVETVWSAPGSAPYVKSLASMRATDFWTFRGHMESWGVPAANLVYADTSGDIGWTTAGFSPVRPNWDGLLPTPGDGRYEWDGFYPGTKLPMTLNPEAGYFATANEMNLPPDWDQARDQIGYEWMEPSRAERIAEVLNRPGSHGIEDSAALQCDILSIPARRLTALLGSVPSQGGEADQARALFEGWDHRLTTDSAAAALFEVWWARHLRPGLFAAVTDDPDVLALLLPGDPGGVLECLERPDARLGECPESTRNRLLTDTLAAAYSECRNRMGETPSDWKWGHLHRGRFRNATARVEESPSIDPIPEVAVPGSDSTPMNALYSADFTVTLGASVRLVVDVGDWDRSLFINAPGQSGDPRSPHYADLVNQWAEGNYHPLLYTADAIEAAAESRTEFLPEK